MHKSLLTTRQLYAWLPKECKKECKPLLDKMLSDYEKISAYGVEYFTRQMRLHRKTEKFLYHRLLELHTKIQESLEEHGWICKPSWSPLNSSSFKEMEESGGEEGE